MAYTLDISLALGSAKSGLTDLRGQLVDTAGSNVGSAISSGFTEIGAGNYLWHYASFPDGHRGGVKFYSNAAPSTTLAFAAINPEEAENVDAKVSSRAAVGAAMTLTSGERDSVAAALLDLANGIETGYTVRQALRLMASAMAGKLSGAETTTVSIRNLTDGKTRISATVDAFGNRTAVSHDVS
jgi:hypothetical protein